MIAMLKQMKQHQNGVRVSKTAAAVGGVASTAALLLSQNKNNSQFTIPCMIVSSVIAAGTAIWDTVETKSAKDGIETKLNMLEGSREKLEERLKAVEEEYVTLAKNMGIIKNKAHGSSFQGAMNVANIIGSSIRVGGSLSELGLVGAGGAAIAARGGAEVIVSVARTLGVATSAIGTVIGITDAVFSWTSENESLSTTRKLNIKINNGMKELENLKEQLENLLK
ncbi:unnamed protein product [Meganyctiphanes norvegica]|uniref:Uncharacterized protein n=1 Tax=Meganyctiphanes norvegica TaxID=48144 RepID=A0AAV2QIB3_MEGNR